MKIPEEKIEEVREAADIVDVISQHVSLKRRGNSFFGLCPFHHEKSPSFHVDPVKGYFHCFGCGEGGNVFTFIMKMDRITFPEAVRSLAEKKGIDIPEFEEDQNALKETEALYFVNQMASNFYRECLLKTEAGKKAGHYFSDRGFDSPISEYFMIGYAPNLWDGLIQKATREGIHLETMQKAGLIIPRRDGRGYYDRFRGRLIFPVLNTSGRVIGFGGRTLVEAKGVPKYLNSPETAIYRKGQILYGLYQSRDGIRKQDRVLFVEGYTDLMRLHQINLPIGVATSGTALTEGQAHLISRYTKNVILVYDGDSAGFSAAVRGADVLLSAGLHVRVAPLPTGSDPDVFIRDNGIDAFMKIISDANTLVEFQLTRQKRQLKTPADKSRAATDLLETIRKIKDPVERQLMVHDLAESLGVEEALLHQKLRNLNRGITESGKTDSSIVTESARDIAERSILQLILEKGQWAAPVFSFIKPEAFQNKALRGIAEILFEQSSRGHLPDLDRLLNLFSENPESQQRVVSLMSVPIGEEIERDALGLDCILYLLDDKLKQGIQSIRDEMRKIQGHEQELVILRDKWLKLRAERHEMIQNVVKSWKKMVEKF